MEYDMMIELKVTDKEFKGNIQDIVKINEATLTDEFTRQPSVYAWFATLAEIAAAQVEKTKFDLSVTRAKLDSIKRADLANEGKKVTESMVEAAITTDVKIMALTEELIDGGRQLGILKALVRALDQRKDMLIQLGSTKRQEMVLSDFGVDLKKVKTNN